MSEKTQPKVVTVNGTDIEVFEGDMSKKELAEWLKKVDDPKNFLTADEILKQHKKK